MIEHQISEIEREIMRQAYCYLDRHANPPVPGTDESEAWWAQAFADLDALLKGWNCHPLTVAVLMAIYDYIGDKAKEKLKQI